jgi:CheY-like chemotaxis protein
LAPRGLSGETTLNAGTPSLAGVDVLVVDDEDDTLTLFREALEVAGATVRTVRSADDAVRENSNHPADLLVTDLGLAGMDGFELLEVVRRTHPNITAVPVTAFARLDEADSPTRICPHAGQRARDVEPPSVVTVNRQDYLRL